MDNLISPVTVKELATANALRDAQVMGTEGGFWVVVKYGMTERLLAAREVSGRLKPRVFVSLDAAGRHLQKLGLPRFAVDVSGYAPKRAVRPRPARLG